MTEFKSGSKFTINRTAPSILKDDPIAGYSNDYLNGTVVTVTERRKPYGSVGPDGHVWVKADGVDAIWVQGRDLVPYVEAKTKS